MSIATIMEEDVLFLQINRKIRFFNGKHKKQINNFPIEAE